VKIKLKQQRKKLFRYIPLWFILFWIIYFTIEAQLAMQPVFEVPFIYFFIIRIISFVICGYVLAQVIFPILIYRNKFAYFLTLSIALVLILSKFQILMYVFFKLKLYQFYELKYALPNTSFYFIMLILMKFSMDYYLKKKEMAEEQQRRTELELTFLKSQISPHFLFNTINNLYGLAVTKSEKLPNLMLQFSDILRYSLYETNQQYVLLSKEVEYMKSYIELEKIRIGNRLDLTINLNENSIQHIYIAPIILVVFVENAFKHSKSVIDERIKINFDLHIDEDWIVFTSSNNFTRTEKDAASGVGLQNVIKRLDYLYPDQYSLNMGCTNNFYTSTLRIKAKHYD
jgi:two-component system LytT family sensor kinase